MVYNAKIGNPNICILMNSSNLYELVILSVKFGLPYYFNNVEGWG